jgi:hypothetical protein
MPYPKLARIRQRDDTRIDDIDAVIYSKMERLRRIAWIKSTSKLDEMFISDGLLREARGKEKVKMVGDEFEIKFDDSGHLVEFWG